MLLNFSCTSKADRSAVELNTLLDSLQTEYAPDTRVALWDLSVTVENRTVRLDGELACKDSYRAVIEEVVSQFPKVEFGVVLLPETDSGIFVNGLVNNSVIHLRREPSSKKELVTQALLGAPIRILKEQEGRYLVQTPDGYLGWVNKQEVHPVDRVAIAGYRDAEKILFSAQYGFSYSEPDEASMPVADLVIGCILQVVSEKSDFYQVEYPDGRMAWVKRSEAVPAEDVFYRAATKEGVVTTILNYHGIPYLWGGTSSKNIDCSGLVSNVYFMNGILLPRDADQQSRCSRIITVDYDTTGLEAGDLLFFGRRVTDSLPERVTHVTTYLERGEFIHAAGYRERVSINSMDSTMENYIGEYPETFVRAIRIIGEEPAGFQPISQNRFYREIISNKKP
ncbi:MAG: NlpC/P60 family protein [Bacteroidota bacterium]